MVPGCPSTLRVALAGFLRPDRLDARQPCAGGAGSLDGFDPEADIARSAFAKHLQRTSTCPLCANSRHRPSYSITSSARASSVGGTSRCNRTEPICFSPYLYRARNLVERFFNKIKPCRRIATRYDKLAANYLAFVQLTSIRLWLRVNEFLDVMRPFRQECPI